MADLKTEIAERFARETAEHEMTILHDDGLYRHIRFSAPESSAYWFELITTPGQLVFSGDGDAFVFRRLTDMFVFFRSSSGWNPGTRIDETYWAEKLVSDRDAVKEYSRRLLNQLVSDYFRDVQAEKESPGIRRAWREATTGRFPDYDTEHAEGARDALEHFKYQDFAFVDTWEWDLREYSWWYLWACHAIVWGIAQYDAHKAAKTPAGAVAGGIDRG